MVIGVSRCSGAIEEYIRIERQQTNKQTNKRRSQISQQDLKVIPHY